MFLPQAPRSLSYGRMLRPGKRRRRTMAKARLEIEQDLEMSDETWDALLSYTTDELEVVRLDEPTAIRQEY